MPFKGITFAGQNVTPKNDGGLYASHYGNGILWGCSMNLSGDDLVIQSGEFIMGGRVVQVDGATSVDLSGRLLTTGYIQVIMNADLSQSEGSQWYTSFVESATTTFPALTQDDINDTGTLYQIELAVVQISGGNLTNIVSSLGASNIIGKRNMHLMGDETTIYLRESDNTQKGYISINSPNNYMDIIKRYNNAPASGLRLSDTGRATLFGDGNEYIVLRPNGVSSTAGQVTLDADGILNVSGDVRRSAQTYSGSRATSLSVTATNTKICETTVVETGIYLINVTGTVNMSGGGYAYINLYKSSNASNTISYDLHYLKSGNSYIMGTTWATFPANTPCSFYLEPSASCTISNANLYLLRIA